MTRTHRAVTRRERKIDPGVVANRAEDYLYGFKKYRQFLDGVKGLVNTERLVLSIHKIDQMEKEMIKLENELEKISIRRAKEAVKLEDQVMKNLGIVKDYLDPMEYREMGG